MASEQRVRSGESIAAVVTAAGPGDRIVIEPGLYRESVRINKPLELVGDGSGEPVELWPAEGSCLEVQAHQTVLRGLKLHGRSRTPVISVNEWQRGAVVEDCVLTGGSPVVALRGEDIVLKRCLIAEGKTGLHLIRSEDVEINDCAIARNDGPGIVVERGTPVVTDCRIYDNRGPGVAVLPGSTPTIRGCDIYGNAAAGISAEAGVRATVEQCHIHHNGDNEAAVRMVGGHFSRIERCEIDGFGRAGVSVEDGVTDIEKCDIHDGLRAGVVVTGSAGARIRNCEIRDVRGVGISLHDVGFSFKDAPTLTTMVLVCDIHHVDRAGVEIGSNASPSIIGSRIHDNGGAGIVVLPSGGGKLLASRIYDNAVPGIDIQPW